MQPPDAQPNQAPSPSAPQPDPNLDVIGSDAPPAATFEADTDARREGRVLFGDPKRREELKQEVHDAIILLLRIASLGFLVVFIIRLLHFVLPENNAANTGSWEPHGWLADGQLAAIDRVFFSGAVGAFIMQYLRSIFGNQRPPQN